MRGLQISWRNLWRNRQRTFITGSAIAFNTACLIMTFALLRGMTDQMVASATDLTVGDAQIHAKGYLETRSLYKEIPNPEMIMRTAQSSGHKATSRSFGYGLLAMGNKSAGAMFWGINPALESNTFRLASSLKSGKFVSSDAIRGVVLGSKIAKILNVTIGSELVAVAQAADGSLGNEILTASGILKNVGEEIDRAGVFLDAEAFQELFMFSGAHEIAIKVDKGVPFPDLKNSFAHLPDTLEFKTWQELLPMFSDMLKMSQSATWLFGFVFFLAGGLGVLNTMLMATHDRTREFGVLKALGTSPLRILLNVSIEAMLLALVSTGIGAAMGMIGNRYLAAYGIDLSGIDGSMSFGGVAFDPIWRASYNLWDILTPVILMWIVCLLASLYPGVKAARMNALAAMSRV